MANWISEPEFNRWYIKWSALDWVRSALVGLFAASSGYIYRMTVSNFTPIIAGLLGFIAASLLMIIIALIFSLRRKSAITPVESPLELYKGSLRWREGRLKQVASQTFRNQEVHLDGIEYIDCTFDGVTFVYEGTGKTSITRSIIKPDPIGKPNAQFKTGNVIVGTTALILHSMGFFRPEAMRRIESIPLDRQ